MVRVLQGLAAMMSVLLAACGAPPRANAPYSAPTPPRPAPTIVHSYQVTVVDAAGNPFSGAAVKLTLEGNKNTVSQSSDCVTDGQGRCPLANFQVGRDASLSYSLPYSSRVNAEGAKEGYYPAKATGSSFYGSSTGISKEQVQHIKLTMLRPMDYIDDNLANSAADRELRDRVLRFLELIRVQSVLVDADVMLKGIGTSEFKGRKYLRIKVNSTNVFNSLRLDKYAVGKRLFDDTVRKVLNPLNDVIAAPRAYHGYDLVVYGHSKSFTDKYAVADKLEFRFLMPEASVRKYKDKDISGQALLDQSVLLLDDERIDMKLQ